ncbi:50S ribosomal protein L25 [Tepidibacillus marianensis]|uniref:50S ribosomal protein L25 n=1 Tax=Tepidibacillus marianensis TaxID=3131995 RepID=UPI0030D32DAD
MKLAEQSIPVKINEIQRNPVDRNIIHVDLQRVDMDQPVEMFVPIQYFGQSLGEKNGGIIQQQLREVEVRALPNHIPEYVQVNITDLDIGDFLSVKDLLLPEEAEILNDLNSVILKVLPPKMDLEEHTEEPQSEPQIINARDSHGIDAAK